MEKLDPKNDGASQNIIEKNIQIIKKLFPEVFTEGKINFDVLKAVLGDYIDDKQEQYRLNWNGKGLARRIAQTQSTGTLRPCPKESINWDLTKNIFIEGDNLEVLKLLQKSYHKRVKLIYIDPPYNTGNEFIYPDKFADNLKTYLRYTGQSGEEGLKFSTNTETAGRYHTNWLNMMLPRLKLARNLLTDDGVIFISIDDNESHNLRHLCDEVFGSENFKANISWQKRYTRSNNTVDFTTVIEHILVYAKSEQFAVNLLPRTMEADARYKNPDNDPRGPWKGASLLNPATPEQRPNLCYPITNPKTDEVTYPSTNAWRRSKEEFDKLQSDNRLYWGSNGMQPVPSIKMFLSEVRGLTPINFWSHEYAGNTDDGTKNLQDCILGKVFDNPKPVKLIRRVIEHGCGSEDIILDFFAGSCSTAQAVIEINAEDGGQRSFIMVQLPETVPEKSAAYKSGYKSIADIGKNRIRKVMDKIKSQRETKKNQQVEILPGMGENLTEIDLGFKIFKLDSSNIKPWDGSFDNLEESLFDAVNNIKSDRNESDLLYELLLKYGLDLCVAIETRKFRGTTVYIIGAGALIVCLGKLISLEIVEDIAGLKNELKPEVMRVVFKDACFKDGVIKTNAVQVLHQAGIEDIKSL